MRRRRYVWLTAAVFAGGACSFDTSGYGEGNDRSVVPTVDASRSSATRAAGGGGGGASGGRIHFNTAGSLMALGTVSPPAE